MAVLERAAITIKEIMDMLPATFTKRGLTEAEYFDLCAKFDDAFVEYTADGTVIVMPLTDPETSRRVIDVVSQLNRWAQQDGRGFVTGPDGGFLFPSGARRGPDAAWMEEQRWKDAQKPGARVPVFAPEFVIEVRSPEQRARTQREKMQEYVANGVLLGWLIDPLERRVTIYRPGREPEIQTNPTQIAGEGPVTGFVLDLTRIFRGELR